MGTIVKTIPISADHLVHTKENPECESNKYKIYGTKKGQSGVIYYQCVDCGIIIRAKRTLLKKK